MIVLSEFVVSFANSLKRVDATRPVASNRGGTRTFGAGIGPHSEDKIVSLVLNDMANDGVIPPAQIHVPYPDSPRQKLDALVELNGVRIAAEFKLLRFLGDNGLKNDNMLMHVLSPYAQDRSAITDCEKLQVWREQAQPAIVIIGFEHEEWPLKPALDSFEMLARGLFPEIDLGPRTESRVHGLVHPVHDRAVICGWTV